MRKTVRVIASGDFDNLVVVDAETGEALHGVQEISYTAKAGEGSVLTLTIVDPAVNIVAEADVPGDDEDADEKPRRRAKANHTAPDVELENPTPSASASNPPGGSASAGEEKP